MGESAGLQKGDIIRNVQDMGGNFLTDKTVLNDSQKLRKEIKKVQAIVGVITLSDSVEPKVEDAAQTMKDLGFEHLPRDPVSAAKTVSERKRYHDIKNSSAVIEYRKELERIRKSHNGGSDESQTS